MPKPSQWRVRAFLVGAILFNALALIFFTLWIGGMRRARRVFGIDYGSEARLARTVSADACADARVRTRSTQRIYLTRSLADARTRARASGTKARSRVPAATSRSEYRLYLGIADGVSSIARGWMCWYLK